MLRLLGRIEEVRLWWGYTGQQEWTIMNQVESPYVTQIGDCKMETSGIGFSWWLRQDQLLTRVSQRRELHSEAMSVRALSWFWHNQLAGHLITCESSCSRPTLCPGALLTFGIYSSFVDNSTACSLNLRISAISTILTLYAFLDHNHDFLDSPNCTKCKSQYTNSHMEKM